jgi:hypothetical protein
VGAGRDGEETRKWSSAARSVDVKQGTSVGSLEGLASRRFVRTRFDIVGMEAGDELGTVRPEASAWGPKMRREVSKLQLDQGRGGKAYSPLHTAARARARPIGSLRGIQLAKTSFEAGEGRL